MNPLALILCFAVGITLALLGGGGSVLTVPIFVYAAGFDAHQAISLSLLVIALTSSLAASRYFVKGYIHIKLFIVFSTFGSLGAFLGSKISFFFPSHVLLAIFGGLMLTIGILFFFKETPEEESGPINCQPKFLSSAAISFGLGALTGILGAGGGFMIVPALALIMKCSLRASIATSLAVIAVNSTVAFGGHLNQLSVPLSIGIVYAAITSLGAFLGTYLTRKINTFFLKRAFSLLISTTGIFLIWQNVLLWKGASS